MDHFKWPMISVIIYSLNLFVRGLLEAPAAWRDWVDLKFERRPLPLVRLPPADRLCFVCMLLLAFKFGDRLPFSVCRSAASSVFHGRAAWLGVFWFCSILFSVIRQNMLIDGYCCWAWLRFWFKLEFNLFLNPYWLCLLPLAVLPERSLSLLDSFGPTTTSAKSELYCAISAPFTRSFSLSILCLVSSPTSTPWYFLKPPW